MDIHPLDAGPPNGWPKNGHAAKDPSGGSASNGKPTSAGRDAAPDIGAAAATPARSRELAALLKMLSQSSDAREEMVADIRGQIEEGSYLTEEKLNLAIYRLLKDILS